MQLIGHYLDLTKLKFVNNYGKDWEIAYNDHLWEYFSYHGVTPNGERLNLPTTFAPSPIEFITVDLEFPLPEGSDESK